MSKNTFPRLSGKGSGLSYNTLAKRQNGEVLLSYIAIKVWHQAHGLMELGRLSAGRNMGLTGLEPVTLRLSSACSNQLSYRPKVRFQNPTVSFDI